ncbi:MAG: cell division protein ZapA [Desulfobulbus sp.]|jgi:hypothetical protein
MQERLIHVELFGQTYTFYSDVTDDELASVVELVKAELEREHRTGPGTGVSNKVLVLGCLRLASRLLRVEREYEAYRREEADAAGLLADRVFAQLE